MNRDTHPVGHEPMARQPSPVQRVLPLLDPLLGWRPHHSFGATVTMKPTRGNSSPLCHSTLATTRRARSHSRHDTKSRRIGSLDASAASPQVVSAVERSRIAALCCSAAVLRRRHAAPPGTHRCPAWQMRRRRERTVAAVPRLPAPASTRARYARSPHELSALTELVEHEQWVIARAPKVSVVRLPPALRIPGSRTVHVQDHPPVRRAGHSSSTHLAFTRPNPSTLPSWVSTSVSNRLMVLVLAAGRCLGLQRLPASSDRRPTVQHRWYPRSLPDDCTPTA